MREVLLKYDLLILIISNLASQYTPLSGISSFLFYCSLIVGVYLTITNFNIIQNPDYRNSMPLLIAFIIIYTAYNFTIGIQYWTFDSWNYYLARVVTLLIVFYGIVTNYEFYFKKVIFWQSIVIALCIIYGTITDSTAAQGRLYLAFGNPNSTSAISTIGVAGFLFSKDKNKIIWILGFIICMWGVFAGGSRTMTFICLIALLYRFRISFKTIILIAFSAIVVLKILPLLGMNTIAVDRLIDVFENGNFVGSRKEVREATMMMIDQRPIEGWGFKSGIQGDAQKISAMGSHNGYLDIIKAMGYPFAIMIFISIAYCLYKIRYFLLTHNAYINYHIFIIITVLLGSMYESMLHGVNYLLNTLFYTSISLITFTEYFGIENIEDD